MNVIISSSVCRKKSVQRQKVSNMSSLVSSNRHGILLVDRNGEYLSQTRRRSSHDSEDSYAEVSSDDSYYSDSGDLAEYWDPYVYQLQMRAPKAHCISCSQHLPDRPVYYGEEYHGSITREETSRLLGNNDGNYLVRQGLSQSGTYSLSFVFDHQVRHYRLYHDGHDHFVGEKPFETIEDLVQDGLITLYMELNKVEEYLKSARETMRRRPTKLATNSQVRLRDPIQAAMEAGVEDLHLDKNSRPTKRPPIYTRCTIPGRRDSVRTSIRSTAEVPAGPKEVAMETPEDKVKEEPPKRTRNQSSSMYYHYEKPHNFKLHNYIGMIWCDHCRNFMWGLRNQGFKCKDCGYNAHKQCKDEIPPDCTPTRQLIKRAVNALKPNKASCLWAAAVSLLTMVFGVELTTLVRMQSTKVPLVIKDCIEEVERRGLDIDGLYRISGKANDLLKLKKEFDNEMCADLLAVEDVHAITGTLKLFLRELPIPLLTFDAYDLCLIAARTGSLGESLEMLRVALSRLPPAHYNTLRHLMRHLHKVQQHKDDNRMDSKNLAVVFTPSLMRSPYNTNEIVAVQKLPEQKKAIDMLIQHFHSLFS